MAQAPPYNFRNESTQEILKVMGGIIENGVPMHANAAFAALEQAPEKVRDEVLEGLENKAVSQAKKIGEAWNHIDRSLAAPGEVDERKQQKSDLLRTYWHSIWPLAQVFYNLAARDINGVQPWTRICATKFMKLEEKDTLEKVVKYFGETCALTEQAADAVPLSDHDKQKLAIEGIYLALHSTSAAKAIAQLQMCDDSLRARLIEGCEARFIDEIKGDAAFGKDILFEYLRNNLTFSKYIAEVRGTAADPLLKAYIDIVSCMPMEDKYFHPKELFETVQSHATAITSQQKLKQLADARRRKTRGVRL